MKTKIDVMMLAAGLGTRMRPHTDRMPKPAIPFLNIPLVFYPLYLINENFQINNLVVNLHHLPDIVKNTLHASKVPIRNQHFSYEQPLILGSGGGLGHAKKYFAESNDILLTNSDEVILPENPHFLREALIQHKKNNALATLIVMDHHLVGSQFGGVWVDKNQTVQGFGKTAPTQTLSGLHFLGLQFLSNRIFNYIPENIESNILYDVLTKAIAQGELVQVFKIDALWFETGNPVDFLSASRECLNILTNPQINQHSYLKKQVDEQANSTLFIAKDKVTLVSKNSESNRLNLQGYVVIGANSKTDHNITIKNSVIADNIRLDSESLIENKLITF